MSAPIPATLRLAATRLLDRAKQAPPAVDTALMLLAADALITYSCEATAEADPGGLSEL